MKNFFDFLTLISDEAYETFRSSNFCGYLDWLASPYAQLPSLYPVLFSTLVELLLEQEAKPERAQEFRQYFKEMKLSGEPGQLIELTVFVDGQLVPLLEWARGSDLRAGETVFLHSSFHRLVVDIGDSFDLDVEEVVQKVLPHYHGYLHAWLDAENIRINFPSAQARKQNFYAHHMLDYFEFLSNTPNSGITADEIQARDILRARRKHVFRYVLVAKKNPEKSPIKTSRRQGLESFSTAVEAVFAQVAKQAPAEEFDFIKTSFSDALEAGRLKLPANLLAPLSEGQKTRLTDFIRLKAARDKLEEISFSFVPDLIQPLLVEMDKTLQGSW